MTAWLLLTDQGQTDELGVLAFAQVTSVWLSARRQRFAPSLIRGPEHTCRWLEKGMSVIYACSCTHGAAFLFESKKL